jgi:hypothetical protein
MNEMQQSGYSAMDWRIAVFREDAIAHWFGKIALSDRRPQSACGELYDVNPSVLIERDRQPLCSACQRIMEYEP